jgi:hypothetical protein
MKWLVRGALLLAALAVLAVIALAVALPRVAGSAAARARIESAAQAALGRELRFESLEAGLFPPSLRVVGPRIAGATPAAAPLLEAKSISLRLALLPLLVRKLAIDSLVVDGATLHVARSRKGLDLPTPHGPGSAPEAAPAGDGAKLDLAVRSVRLRDSKLVLDDRAVSPPVTWELRDVNADAKGRLLGERIDLDASAALASGGRVRVKGDATFAGALDLELELEKLALAPLSAYVKGVDLRAGRASGKAHVAGAAADPESASADLSFDELDFRQGPLRVAGPLHVEAKLTTPVRAPAGPFSADAAGAEIGYGESFHKPAGTPAHVAGRIAAAPGGGVAIEDLSLTLRDLELRGRVARLSPLQVELRSETFEVGGFDHLLPALAKASPSGRMRVESLAYAASPAALSGRVTLDGVQAAFAGHPPIALRGAVVAQGQSLLLEGGRLSAGGQDFTLDARLEDLFGAPHYRVGLEGSGRDANQVVSALAGRPDLLFGLLGLQASFAGPLRGDLVRSMQGRAGFGVDDGRLAGVSLLRSVVDRLGASGSLVLDLGRAFGGRDLQRFYSDAFDTLRGTFDVQDGVARTDDLTFAYRGYAVVLRGTLGLLDLSLDTEGELTLSEELDGLVAKQLGLRDYTPVRRSIPLAAVTGSLASPTVRLAPRTAAALAAAYAGPAYAAPLRKQAEKVLGEGGGTVVDEGLKVLDGLLGSGRRNRSQTAPAPESGDAPARDPAGSAAPSPAPDPATSGAASPGSE